MASLIDIFNEIKAAEVGKYPDSSEPLNLVSAEWYQDFLSETCEGLRVGQRSSYSLDNEGNLKYLAYCSTTLIRYWVEQTRLYTQALRDGKIPYFGTPLKNGIEYTDGLINHPDFPRENSRIRRFIIHRQVDQLVIVNRDSESLPATASTTTTNWQGDKLRYVTKLFGSWIGSIGWSVESEKRGISQASRDFQEEAKMLAEGGTSFAYFARMTKSDRQIFSAAI